ncbi:PP2C family protein-serine/threonine phosphatase [Kitasatospora sp. NPDC089913]|uniref:PP2C family protein-serine/threonine phosphatase n=1 Tax=Kitasatospora sp. NPDC089913 TaxID=3364080 RepID=UPI0037F68000
MISSDVWTVAGENLPAPRTSGAPRSDWAAGLHRIWLRAQTTTDVTGLSDELYDLLLTVPRVTVVTGCRFSSNGRALYLRSSAEAGSPPVRVLLPAGDAWSRAGVPPAHGEVRRFRADDSHGRARPEQPVWEAASATHVVECTLPLEDGDWAAVAVGLAGDGQAPPALPAMLGQVCDVVASCNTRILHERENARRQARDALLAEASLQMDSSLDTEETLQRVARMTVPAVAEGCLVHLRYPTGYRLVAAAHLAADARESFEAAGRDPVWLAEVLPKVSDLREGVVLTGEQLAGTPFAGHGAAPSGTVTVNPLRARGRLLGTVTFAYQRGAAEIAGPAFLADLALRAALAIDNATLYEQRRQNVRSLQQHLLPAVLPEYPGLELAAAYEVGDAALDVGGDFYDAVAGARSFSLVVGDVCGRGAEAAALTGLARHTLRTLLEDDVAPAAALTRLNRSLRASASSKFVTAIVAALAPRGDGSFALRIATAGHPPVRVLRADGTVHSLNSAPGPLLGVLDDYALPEATEVLRPGDTAVLLTDGITESRAADGAFFEDRLSRVLTGLADHGPRELVTGLARAALDFGRGCADDMAVLAVRAGTATSRDERRAER